jgi:hypothetical protein
MRLSTMDHNHRSSFPPSATSSCVSATTYHSFHDEALYEPASPPRRRAQTEVFHDAQQQGGSGDFDSSCDERPSTATTMKRQDSGYGGSNGATPRNSNSYSRPPPHQPTRRTSNASVAGQPSRPRTRPSTRRSAKSYHHPPSASMTGVNSGPTASYFSSRPSSQHHHQSSSSYFHFPSPDPLEPAADAATRPRTPSASPPTASPSITQLPPQPIHYWTSDRTRRLEYAAIDAASRGIKGWFRRNLIPDCMLASDQGHIAFDDDTGSVRRYRLELEEEPHDEKRRRPGLGSSRSWHFWNSQR